MVNWVDRNPKTTFLLVFVVLYVVGDLLVTKYYLPDVKGIHHSYYNHGLKKNYSGTFWWGDRSYRVYTNSLGFKDSEIREVEKKTDRHRILFIGDSFTEGAGLPYEKTFVSMFLEKIRPLNIDVLNAGVVSYSPKIYYLKLKYLLETTGLDFDELFVFIDISDIHDEVGYIVWEPVVETMAHQLDSYLRSISITYKTLRQHVLNGSAIPFLSKIKQFTNKVYTPVGNNVSEPDSHGTLTEGKATATADGQMTGKSTASVSNRKEGARKNQTFKVPEDFLERRNEERGKWTYKQEIYDKWGEKGLALARFYMDKVYSLMKQHNIKMHIAVYPWPDQIIHNDLNSRQAAFWRTFAEQRNVGFINYFPDFFRLSAEETIRQYYIPGDVHWNEKGHRLVAEKLFQYLMK